jgi:hypothetical protein
MRLASSLYKKQSQKEKCHRSLSLEASTFPSTASHFSRLLGGNVDPSDGSADETGKFSVQKAESALVLHCNLGKLTPQITFITA